MTPHDSERLLLGLAGGRRRIVLIHDADHGWCVTDEVDDPSPDDASARLYRIACFSHCFADTLAGAIAKADVIRNGRSDLAEP